MVKMHALPALNQTIALLLALGRKSSKLSQGNVKARAGEGFHFKEDIADVSACSFAAQQCRVGSSPGGDGAAWGEWRPAYLLPHPLHGHLPLTLGSALPFTMFHVVGTLFHE